ncbi:hypothetical protein BD289DRAFT_508080 [Coniella lustricola]|uniref:FAD-binding PCMH-type domain-containing protein n=1 Tax=Coniella lustricola TaxID=2025994 RepID=A0A2T3A079_9PEZI|nr:hypothetical protein BD289DRAFT_508080 [Coniella lustricola]
MTSPTSRLVEAGLRPEAILLPSDEAYAERQSSYFSCSVRALQPAGILQPQSADQVAHAVRSLVSANVPFAVRSGGHTSWLGSNTIGAEGVTIDLGRMDWVHVLDNGHTIGLGPGNRWGKVYAELAEQGYTVAGGREGHVGVAGLILGGGMAFFTARYGLACDNVVEFEIVLADGRIVRAQRHGEYEDLFRALKGGSNNFGIVTNFKMRALPAPRVWAGMTLHPKEAISEAIVALTEFTDNVPQDVDSNLLCFFTYMEIVVAGALINIAGVATAPAYKKWLEMPTISSTCKMTTLPRLAMDYEQAQDYHNTWFTSTFKNDTQIVAKAAELHEDLVEKLKSLIPDGDFVTQCLFQPFPKLFGQLSAQNGGNVLGIDQQPHNGLLWLAVAQVRTPELEKLAYPLVRDWVDAVREFASTVEGGQGNLPWVYLNYADKTQDPLSSYGMDNVLKIKEAAAKYDPGQVFQTLCPGGFKISAVDVPN